MISFREKSYSLYLGEMQAGILGNETGSGLFASDVKWPAGGIMSDKPPLATIDCPECSAWIEVYPRGAPGDPIRAWKGQDEDVCKVQPLRLCPHIHAVIERQFPGRLP